MINNREVWLSSLSLSNDTMEGKWLRKVFREICAEEALGEHATNRAIEIIGESDEIVDGLGFCLSEHGDMLSQWRGYASDASGMCIGFSIEHLTEIATATRSKEKPGFTLTQVEYDVEKQKTILKPNYERIKQAVDKGAFSGPAGLGLLETRTEEEIQAINAERQEARGKLAEVMIEFIPNLFRLKNPAFKEEREWRLLSVYVKQGEDECEIRASSNGLIPYRKFELPQMENGPIAKVFLGPKNITPIEVVEHFLKRRGFGDVQVDRSEATYR